jgi:hypothetical protein
MEKRSSCAIGRSRSICLSGTGSLSKFYHHVWVAYCLFPCGRFHIACRTTTCNILIKNIIMVHSSPNTTLIRFTKSLIKTVRGCVVRRNVIRPATMSLSGHHQFRIKPL